ncbi:hypothetical protein GQ457_10G004870 [Hibiscus cannabinus]
MASTQPSMLTKDLMHPPRSWVATGDPNGATADATAAMQVTANQNMRTFDVVAVASMESGQRKSKRRAVGV